MVRIARTIATLSDAAAMVIALACLAAALFAQGGRFNQRLDVLTHFAPFWLLGATLAFGYGLIFAAPSLRLALAALASSGRWPPAH